MWFQNRRQRDRNLLRAAEQNGQADTKGDCPPDPSTLSADDDVLPPLIVHEELQPRIPQGCGLKAETAASEFVEARIQQGERRRAGGSSASSPPVCALCRPQHTCRALHLVPVPVPAPVLVECLPK